MNAHDNFTELIQNAVLFAKPVLNSLHSVLSNMIGFLDHLK